MMRQYELVERIKTYDPQVDETLLNRAYVFAMKVHGEQSRDSGDPYFSHPIEVAGILTRLKLDASAIVTALLHDTLEDTPTTYDDLVDLFGEEVANLVHGVTKLSKLELKSEASKQAENFQKLFLAMSKDVRVVLVKLADRLHNMRTLHHVRGEERRKRIAQETMDIYVPLAARMGMHEFREELEDLAFRQINANARDSVVRRLDYLRTESGDIIDRITSKLIKTMSEHGIEADVVGREKRPYSVWRKMQDKAISFGQLSDIYGFRIIVSTVEDCYRALGVLHRTWPAIPGRFKDYISLPKPNDYTSIHTTVIGPEDQRVEVQIRTHQMHEVAENGVAAHWNYKAGSNGKDLSGGNPYRWLKELVEHLAEGDNPEEFLEHTKLEMFQDQVFCFTPTGELIALPRGATPIDFAYAVHTNIGHTCVGAKIDGHHRPLTTKLQNGDGVEILRSTEQKPMPMWESMVVTGKARSAIRRFIRQAEIEEFERLGNEMIRARFSAEAARLSDRRIKAALPKLGFKTKEELYAEVGRGAVGVDDVLFAVHPQKDEANKKKKKKKVKKQPEAIPISGLISGLAVHIAPCCYPLPGDRIVGIVTPGKGITVHTIDCETLEQFSEMPDRWLDVAWTADAQESIQPLSRLLVVLTNEPGALGAVSVAIGQNEGNISNLKITKRGTDFFELAVDVEVREVKHLNMIIASMNTLDAVISVERVRG